MVFFIKLVGNQNTRSNQQMFVTMFIKWIIVRITLRESNKSFKTQKGVRVIHRKSTFYPQAVKFFLNF